MSVLLALDFSRARSRELAALEHAVDSVEDGGGSGGSLDNQPVIRHLRRRTTSHNSRRMPVRTRLSIGAQQAAQASSDGVKKEEKNPCRAKRRRPRTLMAAHDPHEDGGGGDVRWLETHLWHAKRMHMCERWGWRLPARPCDRGDRAAQRTASTRCVAHDVTYERAFELVSHDAQALFDTLRTLFDPMCMGHCDLADPSCLDGSRAGDATMYSPGEGFPCGAICPVLFLFQPSSREASTSPAAVRRVWLWVHPAAEEEAMVAIETAAQQQRQSVRFGRVAGGLVRFELRGPKTGEVIRRVLQPARGAADDAQRLNADVWALLADAVPRSSGLLPCGTVLSLEVMDPRDLSSAAENDTGDSSDGAAAATVTRGKSGKRRGKRGRRPPRWDFKRNRPCRRRPGERSSSPPAANLDAQFGALSSGSPLWNDSERRASSEAIALRRQGAINLERFRARETERNALLEMAGVNKGSSAKRQKREHSLMSLDASVPDETFQRDGAREDGGGSEAAGVAETAAARPSGSPLTVPVLLIARRSFTNGTRGTSAGAAHADAGNGGESCDSTDSFLAGWDLVVPAGWGTAFWNAVVFAGAKAIGIDDKRAIAAQRCVPFFPQDFPDTRTGQMDLVAAVDLARATRARRPKGACEYPDRDTCAPDWPATIERHRQRAGGGGGGGDGAFCVIRGHHRNPVTGGLEPNASAFISPRRRTRRRCDESTPPGVTLLPVPTLLCVSLRMTSRGVPSTDELVCLPTTSDYAAWHDPTRALQEDDADKAAGKRRHWRGIDLADKDGEERVEIGRVSSGAFCEARGCGVGLAFCVAEAVQALYCAAHEAYGNPKLVLVRARGSQLYQPAIMQVSLH